MGLGETKKEEAMKTEAIDNTAEVKKELQRQKKVRILIPSTETQRDDVSVAVNGYAYNIKRDAEVEVPESVVEVLKNARTTTYIQRKREDGGEGNELIPQHSPRFAFQILG